MGSLSCTELGTAQPQLVLNFFAKFSLNVLNFFVKSDKIAQNSSQNRTFYIQDLGLKCKTPLRLKASVEEVEGFMGT